jgi:hypothetical protein
VGSRGQLLTRDDALWRRQNGLMDDRDKIGAAYLDHLTDADLRELVHADDVAPAEAAARIAALRRAPGLLVDVLDRPAVSARILNLIGPAGSASFALISPFLVFAAAVHRIATDLRDSGYAPERTSARLRIPVFDGPQLAAYLNAPAHRLYLAELLASFARSSSGVIITRTPQGPRRRRWNDLDLGRLAVLVAALPEQDRPPVWRRLGDLALFLTGVFPAALERALAGRLDPAWLARSTGLPVLPSPDLGPAELFEWFGAGWYRLAARHTATAAATVPVLRDNAEHFHQARRVLNATADRYLFPIGLDWFTPRPAG